MDPDGNYESRMSYTNITSSDNKVDALRDESKDPFDDKNEDRRGDLGASAPPLSQLSIVTNGEVCKTSATVEKEAKNLSPPDEPTLNSVVVPIGPGTADTAPVAYPIAVATSGTGAGVALPETPGNSQPLSSSGECLSDKTETATGTCQTKKIIFICLTLIVLAGVAAGVTISLLPDQSPEEEGSAHMTLHDFYPSCHVPNENWVGNGKCDGLPYNSQVCGWDGGDCPPKTGGGQGGTRGEVIGDDGDNNDGRVEPDVSLDENSDDTRPDNDEDDHGGAGDDDNDMEHKGSQPIVSDVPNDPNEMEAKASIYPECGVRDISKVGDDHCDRGVFDTAVCGWDGGDCLKEDWPNCYITDPMSLRALGDGVCNGSLDFLECGFDLGDCKPGVNVDKLKQIVRDYPGCYFEDMEVDDFADGFCDDWGDWNYNTAECGYDGGDCILEDYPDCHVEDGWFVGDGDCDSGEHNTEVCGWDGGDCIEFNRKYPNCQVDDPSDIGNGECDGEEYNTEECGWDGGDCETEEAKSAEEPNNGTDDTTAPNTKGTDQPAIEQYPDCNVDYPEWIGDGHCNDGWVGYDTEACGYDAGDCIEARTRYPNCKAQLEYVGNGLCDSVFGEDDNTEDCEWDGGDCVEVNKYPKCRSDSDCVWSFGDGHCDDKYSSAEYGWDGGDCEAEETTEPTPTEEPTDEGSYDATGAGTPLNYPDCFLEWPEYVGDGHCDAGLDPFWYGLYNVEECGWDGGDCDEENALLWKKYPECKGGVDPPAVGDGHCDGGAHNTAECGWDGGDCEQINRKFPNCDKAKIDLLDNGFCTDSLNTAKCGWDGGDCFFDEFSDEKCNGSVLSTWSNKSRAWCQKKCLDEGSSCKAYDIGVYYESETGRCRIFSSYSSKSRKNDSRCYKKK